jgi:ribonuclease P protein component
LEVIGVIRYLLFPGGLVSWALFVRRNRLEENLPTKQHQPEENARVSTPDADPVRPPDFEKKAGQGKKAPGCLNEKSSNLHFPRSMRVRSRTDFLRAQKNGRRVQGRLLVLLSISNGLPYSRFGVTVSRRIGSSVRRNRVKRRIREIQRLNRARLLPAYDIVTIAKRGARTATYAELESEFLNLVRRAGLHLEADQ